MSQEGRPYVILPAHGFLGKEMRSFGKGNRSLKTLLSARSNDASSARSSGLSGSTIQVVDSVAEDGPKLVIMESEVARALRSGLGGFQVVPVRRYKAALRPMQVVRSKGLFTSASKKTQYTIHVKSKTSGAPLENATIVAICQRATNMGVRRRSGKNGLATVTLPGVTGHLDRLFVYGPPGHWGFYAENVLLKANHQIELQGIDVTVADFLQHEYGSLQGNRGKGVKVAVIDSGVDTSHSNVAVQGGANFAPDGDINDFGAGTPHGTHVAGILGGRAGMRGIAPKAQLYSYRVFPKTGGSASSFGVIRAIYRAVDDGCDVINLSLGGGLSDKAVNEAIGYAFERGVVSVAAAGNEYRKNVAFPASFKRTIAVSAIGKEGTFPDDSVELAEMGHPRSTKDAAIFFCGIQQYGARDRFYCSWGRHCLDIS